MANPEHLAILKQGVEIWNRWRHQHRIIRPDLADINFNEVHLPRDVIQNFRLSTDSGEMRHLRVRLHRVDFSFADLCNTDLTGANLDEANVTGADLRGANLHRASLRRADLRRANLAGANLREADLVGAIFQEIEMAQVDLSAARFGGTVFGGPDLAKARGLEVALHLSPSTIGVDSLFASHGKIPNAFLRGCGVPDAIIEFAESLVGRPLNFYSCFISHSAKDKPFCERLYTDLQAEGVRVWYFPEDAAWGETVWGEIDHSIKTYDKLIVVCSANSLQSGPVSREVERELNREDTEDKSILFPIMLDRYVFDIWEHPRKVDVLAKVVGDFSGWDLDTTKYEKAFGRLLNGLQAENQK